jgi:hypothetical protein
MTIVTITRPRQVVKRSRELVGVLVSSAETIIDLRRGLVRRIVYGDSKIESDQTNRFIDSGPEAVQREFSSLRMWPYIAEVAINYNN